MIKELQNSRTKKKRNSGTKTQNSDTKTHCSVFCYGTEVQKRNSGTKTHCSVFVPLWKNGTVVQKKKEKKETVPWGCLRFVIVIFPDHTYLLFLQKRKSHTKTYTVSFCSVVSCEKKLDVPCIFWLKSERSQAGLSSMYFLKIKILDKFEGH